MSFFRAKPVFFATLACFLGILRLQSPAAQAAPGVPGPLESAFRPLVRDESLSRAATRHLQALLEGRSEARLSAVRATLRAEGLADAQVLPFAALGATQPELEVKALQFLDARIAERGFTHYGLATGASGSRRALVVFFVRRLVELPPLPKDRPPRSLRGLLLTKTRQVEGFFTLASGEVQRAPAERRGRSVRVRAPEDEDVRALELIVHTDRGPEVAAWVSYHPAPRSESGPIDDAASLVTAIAELRARHGRPSLVPSTGLAKAAAEHARWVCDTRLAVHLRPDGESPVERAQRVGHLGVVLENIAIAPTLREAHQNLIDSPSHRMNLLAPEARSIGVGIAERALPSGPMFCVVEVLGYSGL